MKYTLLELTQAVASSMDSDEVNSISDSVESQQIALVIRTAYYDIVSRLNIPEHHTLFNLTASGDNTKPVLMYVPSDVSKIEWVQYDWSSLTDLTAGYTDIQFLPIKTLLDRLNGLDTTATNVATFNQVVGSSTLEFRYVNDTPPQFYSSFDDRTIVFDSFDSAVDTTLVSAKTRCYGTKNIPWEMSDSFVPALDEAQHPLLLNECKALAWTELKQTPHAKAEQNARRHWLKSLKSKDAVEALSDFDKLPNFGRR